MTRKILRHLSWPVLVAGLSSPLLMNCDKMPKGIPGADKLPGKANCPEMNAEALASFDWAGEFKIDAKVGGKLKGGVAAAVELKAIADAIDADLKVACGGIAKDLGGKADAATGTEQCKLAIKAIGDIKAKMGANAKVALAIKPPHCAASMKVVADCAGKCDVNVKPGSAEVKCEPGKLQGSCSAECKGSCDMKVAAKCSGTCQGTCDAKMSGKCGGKCDGKCDGKVMDAKANGQCGGTCDGKCDAKIEGKCEGSCNGGCEMQAGGKCEGTCTGDCSVKMEAPKCTGKITPPEMSADCKAHCDADATAKVECTPASVAVVIEGAADMAAAGQFKAAMEKNLPLVLKIAIGMKDRALALAGEVKGVAEGGIAVVGELKSSVSDPAKAAMAGQLVACVTAPFQGAIAAAGSLQANVNVSVDVKASAEAKGSAGGKAGGGG